MITSIKTPRVTVSGYHQAWMGCSQFCWVVFSFLSLRADRQFMIIFKCVIIAGNEGIRLKCKVKKIYRPTLAFWNIVQISLKGISYETLLPLMHHELKFCCMCYSEEEKKANQFLYTHFVFFFYRRCMIKMLMVITHWWRIITVSHISCFQVRHSVFKLQMSVTHNL